MNEDWKVHLYSEIIMVARVTSGGAPTMHKTLLETWWSSCFSSMDFSNTVYKNKAFHGNLNERALSELQKYYSGSAKTNMLKVSMKRIISWELCLFRCGKKNPTWLAHVTDSRPSGRFFWLVLLNSLLEFWSMLKVLSGFTLNNKNLFYLCSTCTSLKFGRSSYWCFFSF